MKIDSLFGYFMIKMEFVKNTQTKIKLDEQGQFFRNWHDHVGFTSFLTQSYDLWISEILPKQITARVLKTDVSSIFFRNIFMQPAGKLEDPSTYPNDARLRDNTYLTTGYFDIVERFNNGTEESENRIMFGQIPAMIGSSLCITRTSIDKATNIAYNSMQERLAGMNEFRETLKDQAGRFVTIQEMHSELETIKVNIRTLELARAELQGKASQTSVYIAYAFTALGILISLIKLLL